MINLNSLLTGADSGGTWATTSPCGDSATNPDTIDLTDPTSVSFAGKALGNYTFYYSHNITGCTAECTAVIVEAVDCCNVIINSVTITDICPYELVINYTTASTASYLYLLLKDSTGTVQYRNQLDNSVTIAGTHTVTVTDIPCVNMDETWSVELCCTNQSNIPI